MFSFQESLKHINFYLNDNFFFILSLQQQSKRVHIQNVSAHSRANIKVISLGKIFIRKNKNHKNKFIIKSVTFFNVVLLWRRYRSVCLEFILLLYFKQHIAMMLFIMIGEGKRFVFSCVRGVEKLKHNLRRKILHYIYRS